MIKTKVIGKLDNFYRLFENALKTKNVKKLKDLADSIKTFEDLFIQNYNKRKKEGVYYTNEIIAKFIAKEVIYRHIFKSIKYEYENLTSPLNFEDLKSLEFSLKQKIHDSLLNISICDPACGSGIFLISIAEYIYKILKILEISSNNSKLKFKIFKNLSGLDINKQAIQLCRVRLIAWLFEDNIHEYDEIHSILKRNLKVGNSILNPDEIEKKHDIVVGNPPYGNILTREEKEQLKKENIFSKDIYCAFLLKAVNWSGEITAFLIPKSFLLRQGYIRFRNLFLSKVNIVKIIDIGPNIFKDATNEVQILIYEKKEEHNTSLEIYDYPYEKINEYKNRNFDSLRICFNKNCPLAKKSKKIYVYTFKEKCPYCNLSTVQMYRIRIKPSKEIYKIINKIENFGNLNYLNVVDFPRMIRGEEDQGLRNIRNLIENNTNHSCYFVNAKEDFHYYYLNKNKSFNLEKISEKLLKGNNYEYYKGSKLLIKHNNIIPEAIYTEDTVCFTSSIYSLLNADKKELLYLCAVLNSALVQFYCIYAINNQKHTTINLNQYMIRHLPLIKPNSEIKLKICEKVDLITRNLEKFNGHINEILKQEIRNIDVILFDLYSIDEKEQKLILSSVKNQISYFNFIYG